MNALPSGCGASAQAPPCAAARAVNSNNGGFGLQLQAIDDLKCENERVATQQATAMAIALAAAVQRVADCARAGRADRPAKQTDKQTNKQTHKQISGG